MDSAVGSKGGSFSGMLGLDMKRCVPRCYRIRLEYHCVEPVFTTCRVAQQTDRYFASQEIFFLPYAVLMLSPAIRKRLRVFALAALTLFAARPAVCSDGG